MIVKKCIRNLANHLFSMQAGHILSNCRRYKRLLSIKFPYSFKTKLDELKNYFKPGNKETSDTFFGSVESLNGNEGDDGRRSGEVILALIIEGEIVNARVNLDSDWYEIAYKAHGQGGGLVKVTGNLLPGNRIRSLNEVSIFSIVSK
jgi:hypothetical protein